MRLLADVGGTNTRCALQSGNGPPQFIQPLRNDDFEDLQSVLEKYVAETRPDSPPAHAAICVAAPVSGDHIRLTNRGWEFSINGLRDALGLKYLAVINDFTAVARSLPLLGAGDLRQVGSGRAEPGEALAVLGPGTGLGVSGLIPADGSWAAIQGEGGHVTLAASDAREATVLELLRGQYGHVSAERVLSGRGLVSLYGALAELEGRDVETPDPAGVTARCRDGEPLAVSAVNLFSAMLGTVAANLALTLGARGGVYIAGGVVPNLGDCFGDALFRARFEEKGRYREYLGHIPTYVVTAPYPALRGLQAVLDEAPQEVPV